MMILTWQCENLYHYTDAIRGRTVLNGSVCIIYYNICTYIVVYSGHK